jgi:luciferase family oxidoreductase group 1
MPYALSFLDKSPIHDGEAAQAALTRTIKLAQKAEAAGFHRFWVAEHHNSPGLASSSPEVLIGFLLAHTHHIRIGSGGVMLQHYSAYKVAENFNLLASLAPGRVDLGVGKAPGGLPLSTRALQGAYDPDRKPSFKQQLAELDGFSIMVQRNQMMKTALLPIRFRRKNLNVSCWVRASKVLNLRRRSIGTSSMPDIFRAIRKRSKKRSKPIGQLRTALPF